MFRERIYPHFYQRLWLFGSFCLVLLLFLLSRLWDIQLHKEEQFSESVARQSVRRLRLEPVRGRIFAAGGEVLVDNRPSYNLVFHQAEMRQPGRRIQTINYILAQADALARFLLRPTPLSRSRLERHLRVYPALPLLIFEDLTVVEMAKIAELSPPLPGTEIVTRIVRTYPQPGVASHLLGFTGRRAMEVSPDTEQTAFTRPELAGRDGIEKFYEKELAGCGGEKMVLVDILGYVHSTVGMPMLPVDGNDLILTIDLAAQRAAERAMAPYSGALVAINVTNGAILAMTSSPTYNLAALTRARYEQLQSDNVRKPLFNRAVSGTYLPGSIIKPLTALAALNANAIRASEEVNCTGAYDTGERPIRCWNTQGHGQVNLIYGLEQSCNCYFIHAGLAANFEALQSLFLNTGFGTPPEIDLPAAAAGFVPSRAWAKQTWRRPWMPVDTALISIGQGPIAISPLQAAVYAAALANRGTVFRPFVVQSIRNATGQMRSFTAPVASRRLPVTAKNLNLVRQGMWEVVNGDAGTAKPARTPVMPLAGKTGTAEVDVRSADREKNTWFIGFGPWDNPRVAIAILVERGESGGHTASPIAREFFEHWLGRPATSGDTTAR